jgi:hypothetical protein
VGFLADTGVQRTAFAVEGRNETLTQIEQNQRGVPKHSAKVWIVLPTVDGRAADGTTLATRFVRRAFPALGETVVSQSEVLPRPRPREDEVALGH